MHRLPAEELTSRLYSLRVAERKLLVEFLQALGALDVRKTYLELAFPSTFAFCTDRLGLSRSSAFRRTTAARLLVKFPAIGDYLADGRLGLTTLVELREVLTESTLTDTLDKAAGLSASQVKALVISLSRQAAPAPAPDGSGEPVPEAQDIGEDIPGPPAGGCGEDPESGESGVSSAAELTEAFARIEALSGELHVLRMTVGNGFVQDLESVRDALSHVIPDRNLEKVLHECIRRVLRDHTRRRAGVGSRRSSKKTDETAEGDAGGSRYIPVEVRHLVWRRDGGACAFVSADGRKCQSKYKLEFHHMMPHGKRGPATVTNVSLRCVHHNTYHAIKDYGADWIEAAIRARRASKVSQPSKNPKGDTPGPS